MVKIDIEGREKNDIVGMIELLDSKNNIKILCIEISRNFYGQDTEKNIISLFHKYI